MRLLISPRSTWCPATATFWKQWSPGSAAARNYHEEPRLNYTRSHADFAVTFTLLFFFFQISCQKILFVQFRRRFIYRKYDKGTTHDDKETEIKKRSLSGLKLSYTCCVDILARAYISRGHAYPRTHTTICIQDRSYTRTIRGILLLYKMNIYMVYSGAEKTLLLSWSVNVRVYLFTPTASINDLTVGPHAHNVQQSICITNIPKVRSVAHKRVHFVHKGMWEACGLESQISLPFRIQLKLFVQFI